MSGQKIPNLRDEILAIIDRVDPCLYAGAISDELLGMLYRRLLSNSGNYPILSDGDDQWSALNTAPYNRYVLCYAANRSWSDSRGDPKFVVALRTDRKDYTHPNEEVWDSFGSSQFRTNDFSGWMPLPDAPTS